MKKKILVLVLSLLIPPVGVAVLLAEWYKIEEEMRDKIRDEYEDHIHDLELENTKLQSTIYALTEMKKKATELGEDITMTIKSK